MKVLLLLVLCSVFIFLLNFEVKCQPNGNINQNEEAENKKWQLMMQNFEKQMKEKGNMGGLKQPKELLDYKNYIKSQIMSRAVIPKMNNNNQ